MTEHVVINLDTYDKLKEADRRLTEYLNNGSHQIHYVQTHYNTGLTRPEEVVTLDDVHARKEYINKITFKKLNLAAKRIAELKKELKEVKLRGSFWHGWFFSFKSKDT